MIPLLYLLFILSGAAGLFYESVWSRYLSLFVGHGAYAQVIVLVIFLGGMALGAGLVSRRSAKLNDPLYGYAMIELAVGLLGLVFHDLIYVPVTGWAYDSLFPSLGGGLAVGAVKWILAGLLILPQSILLGATFPLMSAGIIRRAPDRPGSVLSYLYFTNSLGAAVGVLIAGFYLVKLAGLPGTLLAAALVNLIVGLVALFVAKLRPPEETGEAVASQVAASAGETDASTLPLPLLTRLLLLAALGTALASFVYEVAWIRLLSLVLGSATHSFELMLSAFILGLSLGAFFIRRRMERIVRPMAVLVAIQVVMGGFAMLSLALYSNAFGWMSDLMAAVGRTEQGYLVYNILRYGLCLTIMLPATFCAGMTLPLITRTLLTRGAGEQAIGAVYSWNTFGSILGAALASLALIPWLGLKGTLVFGGVLDSLVGVIIVLALVRQGAPLRRLAIISTTFAVVVPAVVLMAVQLEQSLLTSGVFRTGRTNAQGAIKFYRDGRTATVSMAQPPGGRMNIATNGKPDGSLDPVWMKACGEDTLRVMRGDDPTQVLLPLVTLAHRPNAKNVSVIGQGTGMSSHSLLASPRIESLVTIEIEPVMVEASRQFLPANRRVFDDPRSIHVYDDAKAYFAAANRRFDIIVAEPSNPWVSGVAGLFTSEFYDRVKRYMAPGGVLGQWLHTYELNDDLVLTVLAAIHRNFADYRIYAVNTADLLIVAVAEGQLPRPDWSVFQLPEVQRDFCHFYEVTPRDLDALLLTGRMALGPLLDETPAYNSDFFPMLDLGAERARFLRQSAGTVNALYDGLYDWTGPNAAPLLPDDRRHSGIGTVPRISALLAATELRMGLTPADTTQAWQIRPDVANNEAIRRWLDGNRQFTPPPSWANWVRAFSAGFSAWHAGTRGWVDESFMGPLRTWVDRVGAPASVKAAVAFREQMARRDYQAAAAPLGILLEEARAKRYWVEPDLLREGAVIVLLAGGDAGEARKAFEMLTPAVQRGPSDVRTRLLEAYIAGMEKGVTPDTTSP